VVPARSRCDAALIRRIDRVHLVDDSGRMRWLLVASAVLGCGSPTPGVPPARPTRTRTTSAATDQPPAIHARIEHGVRGAWIDIAVAGPEEKARKLCDQTIQSELDEARTIPTAELRIARDCSPEALSAHASPSIGLVEISRVTAESFLIDDPPAPRSERGGANDAVATVTRYRPFADAPSCERIRARLNDEDARWWADLAEHEKQWRQQRLDQANERVDRGCVESRERAATCVRLSGEARTHCDLEAEPSQLLCDELIRQRDDAQLRLVQPLVPPIRTRTCRTP
jgi:hypothetical protein